MQISLPSLLELISYSIIFFLNLWQDDSILPIDLTQLQLFANLI